MARKHEMIGPEAPIPEGMLLGNGVDIISKSVANGISVKCTRLIQIANHRNHTERHEIHMSFFWILRSKSCFSLYPMDESPLCGVYTPARAIVEDRSFTFFVYVDLEHILHFRVAPAPELGLGSDLPSDSLSTRKLGSNVTKVMLHVISLFI